MARGAVGRPLSLGYSLRFRLGRQPAVQLVLATVLLVLLLLLLLLLLL